MQMPSSSLLGWHFTLAQHHQSLSEEIGLEHRFITAANANVVVFNIFLESKIPTCPNAGATDEATRETPRFEPQTRNSTDSNTPAGWVLLTLLLLLLSTLKHRRALQGLLARSVS